MAPIELARQYLRDVGLWRNYKAHTHIVSVSPAMAPGCAVCLFETDYQHIAALQYMVVLVNNNDGSSIIVRTSDYNRAVQTYRRNTYKGKVER